jgi:hypothetical protein
MRPRLGLRNAVKSDFALVGMDVTTAKVSRANPLVDHNQQTRVLSDGGTDRSSMTTAKGLFASPSAEIGPGYEAMSG